jgi:hypothetical protein
MRFWRRSGAIITLLCLFVLSVSAQEASNASKQNTARHTCSTSATSMTVPM